MNTINSPTATNLSRGTIIELAQNVYNNAIAAQEQADRAQEFADRIQGALDGEIASAVYPVGSIYLSVSPSSPAALFGGTWTRIQDRFLLAAGTTYPLGNTGGSASVKINYGNLPASLLRVSKNATASTVTVGSPSSSWMSANVPANGYIASELQQANNLGQADYVTQNNLNTLPPYLAVYMWERIA